MPDISIRNVSDDVYAALKQKAASDNKGLETWLRERLTVLASEPIVKVRYGVKFLNENSSAHGTIKRYEDHPNGVGGGCGNLNEDQFKAYELAKELVRRNQPGDRERVFALLGKHFDIVNEIAV